MSPAGADDMAARYERAMRLQRGVFSKSVAFNTTLYPHWVGGTDCFWYARELADGGWEYRLVDANTASNKPAFDHRGLAQALSDVGGEPVHPHKLPLRRPEIRVAPAEVRFDAFGKRWVFDIVMATIAEETWHSDKIKVSPDGRYAAFQRDGNLWVSDLQTGKVKPLTTDGGEHYVYGGTATAYGRQEEITLEVLWSPDSERLLAVVKDNREVKVGPPLVEHVPPDGSLRPRIVDADRRVAFPGDERVEGYRLLAIDPRTGERVDADYPLCPVFYPPYVGFFTGNRGWWSPDSRRAWFIDLERGGQAGRLLEFDTRTGKTRTVIEERSETRFCFIPDSHVRAMLVPLSESKELIWYSERSGWPHLYLYDLETGQLKHPISQGDWVVRGILHVDAKRRELWIQTAGRTAGRNPYYCDVCRLNIDSGELNEVISSDHEYVVIDGRSRISHSDPSARGVSPTGRFVVVTRSRIDEIPVSVLLDERGDQVLELERADISALPEGWQWPEPVLLKAADGETVIDGAVFRPSDFSPDKSYSVIDCSFGLFLPPVGSFTNNMTQDWVYLTPAALAELGFITVMIGQRGAGRGLRNKEYTKDREYWNCISPHQADCIAGIRQLARRYPYMDLDRVGIGGFGSTHSPAGGMLKFPEFYKVGVAENAYLDHRIVGEFYSDDGPLPAGALDRHPLHEIAGNLRGKLLLIHGMMNPCTPVAATLGLAEALQKANKPFDMLLLPNLGHEHSDYTIRRAWDYYVEHLLGMEPPADFEA